MTLSYPTWSKSLNLRKKHAEKVPLITEYHRGLVDFSWMSSTFHFFWVTHGPLFKLPGSHEVACNNSLAFTGTIISDKRIGALGKLSCLRAVLEPELLNSGRVYLIDDSPEVIGEFAGSSYSIVPVGIRLRKANYQTVPGVHYEQNLFGALEHILRLERRYQ